MTSGRKWLIGGAGIALCALAVWGWSAMQPAPVYGIRAARLPNGMEVVVIENHRAPVVTHMIWYKTGADDEGSGQEGVAHYLEHLMFKGTKTVPDGELSKRVARWGGNDNAFTSRDYTAYFQTVPKEHLHDVMMMEADRMEHLSPAKAAAARELQVVRSERRERTENDPGSRLSEQMDTALYGAVHPYGRPVIGYAQQIEGLNLEKAMAYKTAHYAPNNAIVVISGDTTPKEVEVALRDTYGPLQSREVAPRTLPAEENVNATEVVVTDKSVEQMVVERAVRMPSYTQNPATATALTILADLLDGSTGRLYQALVVDQKIASGVDVSYNPYALGPSSFDISLTPLHGVSKDAAKDALNKVLADIAAKGFSESERAQSLRRIEDASIFARDSMAGPAMNVGFALAAGVPPRVVDNWPRYLRKVELAQINDTARLLTAPAVWGVLRGTK